jgi:hypothetical protein
VPLPAAACDKLRVLLTAQKEYRLAQGPAWNGAGRVVPKKDGTQMAPSTLKSQWWNWVARQKIDPHLPIHGLPDSFGTWVYETYGVKQAQEWLGHGDPATALRHHVRLTTAARAKAVAGLDEVTRAARVPSGRLRRTPSPRSTTSSRSPAGAADPHLTPLSSAPRPSGVVKLPTSPGAQRSDGVRRGLGHPGARPRARTAMTPAGTGRASVRCGSAPSVRSTPWAKGTATMRAAASPGSMSPRSRPACCSAAT